MSIIVSSQKDKLDIDFVYQFLTNSYWAKDRTKEAVRISIENSMCFGIYIGDQQIGFARVVTDYVIFAYLMDVFISKEYRGKGYSKQLMKTIFEHKKLKPVKKWMLATSDAHRLYQQFDFEPLENSSIFMQKSVIK
ncbi:GNAT family N-acetyltransferase [Aquimarina sp. 2201CG1-2-11]|uniref:GNAT family N-acetyltransferase n=1 Tax=Aquimarina discodermiae TaxID=3231043 RepID=UPI00346383FB